MTRRLVENFLYYLTGFFIVSLFLVIAFILAFHNTVESVRNEIEVKLDGGITRLEDLEMRIRMLGNVIVQDSDFNTLVYQDEKSSAAITALKSMNSLYRNLGIIAKDVAYMFTLFPDSQLYLSSVDTSLEWEDYYSKFMRLSIDGKELSSGQELWDRLHSSLAEGQTHLRLDYISATGNVTEYEPVLIIQSSSGLGSRPQSITGYLIGKDVLLSTLLGDSLASVAQVRISDNSQGLVLVDTMAGEDPNADEYYIFEGESELLGYTIELAVPVSYFTSQLWPIIGLLSVVIGAGILSGLAFAAVYALVHYRSVRTIIRSMDGGSSRLIGDFADIQQRIIQLRKEGESFKAEADELGRQNQAIQFQNILLQGPRSQSDREQASRLLPFAEAGYIVAVVRLLKGGKEQWYQDGLYTLLSQSPFAGGLTVPSGSSDEVFILPVRDENEYQSQIERHLGELFQSDADTVFHVGISQPSHEAEELSVLYEEAERALASLYKYESESAYVFYEDEKRTSLLESFNIETLSRLKNLLLRSEESDATALLHDIFHKAAAYPLEAEERKEAIWHSLCNVFQTVFMTLKTDSLETGKFHSDMSMAQMEEHFTSLTHELCEATSRSRKSHNKELLDAILRAIDASYQNQGTSAYTVSRAVGISEKYMLSFFREQIGTSFPQYLLVRRLMTAKAMLENGGESNEHIASATGFGSLNTFYRNFSKYFGLSPKSYRDGLGKESSEADNRL